MWGQDSPGVRWLINHVKGLPEDSRYVQATAGFDRTWTSLHSMLADLFDVMAIAASQQETKKPIEYPRAKTQIEEEELPPATRSEMAAFFGSTGGVQVNGG